MLSAAHLENCLSIEPAFRCGDLQKYKNCMYIRRVCLYNGVTYINTLA